MKRAGGVAVLVLAVLGCGGGAPAPADPHGGGGTMHITSSAFAHQGEIPTKYTCEGDDTAPPLAWSGVPASAKRLALIVDDPDAPDPAAPMRVWVHWVLYDIPASAAGLPEGGALPDGARHGKNDWSKPGYGGPCPPIGRHRYFFKLYALDAPLGDLRQPTKKQLEAAMSGHVVASAELMGTYQKARK
jgi:Raf kinase inhibitor-like YbhB/YbcL family protein